MAWPTSLAVCLKEWASVCHALDSGRQIVLLRKGGIHESAGEFEVEHRQFLLFPTYLHQKKEMLKPSEHEGFTPMSTEPAEVKISAAGVVSDIVQVQSRSQMDAIEAEHVWTPPLIDMRFQYRPENPLYLLLLRVYRLHAPITLENTPAFAGCKSWVPLDQEIPTGDATVVLDDVRFDHKRRRVLEALAR
jgi:hypothetical protein